MLDGKAQLDVKADGPCRRVSFSLVTAGSDLSHLNRGAHIDCEGAVQAENDLRLRMRECQPIALLIYARRAYSSAVPIPSRVDSVT